MSYRAAWVGRPPRPASGINLGAAYAVRNGVSALRKAGHFRWCLHAVNARAAAQKISVRGLPSENATGPVVEFVDDSLDLLGGGECKVVPFGKYCRSKPFDAPMFVKRRRWRHVVVLRPRCEGRDVGPVRA